MGLRNTGLLIGRRARMAGFVVTDYASEFDHAQRWLSGQLKADRIKTKNAYPRRPRSRASRPRHVVPRRKSRQTPGEGGELTGGSVKIALAVAKPTICIVDYSHSIVPGGFEVTS